MVDMYRELDDWASEKALRDSAAQSRKRKRAFTIEKQRRALNSKIAEAENEGDMKKARMYKYHLTKFCKWRHDTN